MYPWVSHTQNPITGHCPHECGYCYMSRGRMRLVSSKPLHISDNELRGINGQGKFIFVGSSTDMFAVGVPGQWIEQVLDRCGRYPKNRYLFQSKNPGRFRELDFPKGSLLGTTIETNRDYHVSKAPIPEARSREFASITGYPKMVSIEPVMAFDLRELTGWIKMIGPEFVSIGADSKACNLPEPSGERLEALIQRLGKFTEVRIKDNLKKLYVRNKVKGKEN